MSKVRPRSDLKKNRHKIYKCNYLNAAPNKRNIFRPLSKKLVRVFLQKLNTYVSSSYYEHYMI